MSPVWVTAVATSISTVALLGAIAVAYVQLQALGRAGGLQSFLALTHEADTAAFLESYAVVVSLGNLTLTDKLRVIADGNGQHLDRVTKFFDRLGFLVGNRDVDRRVAEHWWGAAALEAYDAIADWIQYWQKADPAFCSEFVAFVERVRPSA